MRILVFEDDPMMIKFLEVVLRREGHEVRFFTDPTCCESLASPTCSCARTQPCADALLTDIRMPNMSGLELLELQQRRGCKGSMRNKAAMSASWSAEDRRRAKALGCTLFEKPFSRDELLVWLRQCTDAAA